MKYIFAAFIVLLLTACKTNPYIKASITANKISAGCEQLNAAFSLNSNINGERYEFEDCLDQDFNGKNFTSERRGDTIMINLPRTGPQKAVFKITLDLDAYPEYHFVTVGENTYTIAAVKN